jgi:membrane protein DedA with SNARE-associated domain
MESLIEFLRTFFTQLQHGQLPELGYWNYFVLAFLIVLQGPIVTLLAGAASSAGLFRPEFVFLAAVVANLTADVVWYSVGSNGRLDGVLQHDRIFGIKRENIDKIQLSVERHAAKMLLLAKISAGFAVPALIAAGILRIPWRKWFPVVFVGEALWTGTLLLIGFYATETIKQVERGIEILAIAVALAMLIALVWFVGRTIREQEKLNVAPSEERNSRSL